jgi:hypothetical protein
MSAPGTRPWNAGTGKGWTDRRGYRWIRINGRSVREHRHIMESVLGRRLCGDEVVHHKNGDTTDNRPENLEVVLHGDHTRVHHAGARRPDMAKANMARADRDRERIKQLERQQAEMADLLRQFVAGHSTHGPDACGRGVCDARALLARIEGR